MHIQSLSIDRVIIHQIPKVPLGGHQNAEPVLSETEVALTAAIKDYLRTRIVGSLNSESFGIVYAPTGNEEAEEQADGVAAEGGAEGQDEPSEAPALPADDVSPVPALIVDFFVGEGENFVEASRMSARYLYTQQGRTASAGMLVFVDGTILSAPTGGELGRVLAILKLEMSGALIIEPTKNDEGQATFDVQLRDVTLDKKAKVFKTALFPRATNLADVRGVAADQQRDQADFGSEVANFFLSFLGCKLVDTAERSTKRFWETVEKVGRKIEDPVQRAEFLDKAMVELKSNESAINIVEWTEKHLTPAQADEFINHVKLPDGSVPVVHKDVSMIRPMLGNLLFEFDDGVKLTGPNEVLRQHLKRTAKGTWVLELELRDTRPVKRR